MAKITVYHFEFYDPHSQTMIRSRAKATRRAIEAAEARMLAETAEEVEIEMLDQDGVVVRWPATDTARGR
jgi:ketosteroid isomerase-like protein